MASPKVKLGLAGLDHWYAALELARAAQQSDDVELVAVADCEAVRATEIAERFGIEDAGTDLEGLAADAGVDGVLSFASTDRNPRVCIAAAAAGHHILSIKPFARTREEGEAVVAAVRDAGVAFIPGESLFRFTPWFDQLRAWARDGRLGEPAAAHFWFWAGLPQRWPGDSDPGWFADPARAAGGAWIDHAIYEIDLLRCLWSDEPAGADAMIANVKFGSLAVEDHGVATVRFGSGAVATLEATWASPPGVVFEYGCHITGTEGAALFSSRTGRLSTVGVEPGVWEHAEPGAGQPEETALAHFVSVIRGAQAEATVVDALRNLTAGLACYEASRLGGSVEIETMGQQPASAGR